MTGGNRTLKMIVSTMPLHQPTMRCISDSPTSALPNSCTDILPLPSSSNRSKSSLHAAKKRQRARNSSQSILPLPVLSNIFIIILIVHGSKDV